MTDYAFKAAICAVVALTLSLIAPQALAKTHRDPAQRAAFTKMHPCPSTGKSKGRCPGYFVDHVVPLCASGGDHPSNMQWQTKEDGKKKDRIEQAMCRR